MTKRVGLRARSIFQGLFPGFINNHYSKNKDNDNNSLFSYKTSRIAVLENHLIEVLDIKQKASERTSARLLKLTSKLEVGGD